MSKCELIVTCSNCDEEVEFQFESSKAKGILYLDEGVEELTLDDMKCLEGKKKECPRCDHPIKLTLSMALEAV